MADRFVDFKRYCKDCKHKDTLETEEPCAECLDIPARDNSRKPEYFEDNNERR